MSYKIKSSIAIVVGAVALIFAGLALGAVSPASATTQTEQGECGQEAECPVAEVGQSCDINGVPGTIVDTYEDHNGRTWYLCECEEVEPTTTTTVAPEPTTTSTVPPTTEPTVTVPTVPETTTSTPPTSTPTPTGASAEQGGGAPFEPNPNLVPVAQPASPVAAQPTYTG